MAILQSSFDKHGRINGQKHILDSRHCRQTAFFYLAACHIKPEWFEDEHSGRHFTEDVTYAIAATVFHIEKPNFVGVFLKRCPYCCVHNSRTQNYRVHRSLELLKAPKILHERYERFLMRSGIQETTQSLMGETTLLTEKVMSNWIDFTWEELHKFYYFVARRIAQTVDTSFLQNAYDTYNMNMHETPTFHSFENDMDVVYTKVTDQHKCIPSDILDSFETMMEFLQLLGLVENLQTFEVLNRIYKCLHLHWWRYLIAIEHYRFTETSLPFTNIKSDELRYILTELKNFKFQTIGPYDVVINDEAMSQRIWVLVIENLTTLQMVCVPLLQTDDPLHKISALLSDAIHRFGRKIDNIFVDKHDLLYAEPLQTIGRNLDIQIWAEELPKKSFIDHLIRSYMISDFNELVQFSMVDFLPNLTGILNHTWLPPFTKPLVQGDSKPLALNYTFY